MNLDLILGQRFVSVHQKNCTDERIKYEKAKEDHTECHTKTNDRNKVELAGNKGEERNEKKRQKIMTRETFGRQVGLLASLFFFRFVHIHRTTDEIRSDQKLIVFFLTVLNEKIKFSSEKIVRRKKETTEMKKKIFFLTKTRRKRNR